MSGKTFQVFARQILAIPVDGGFIIAEKVTAATIHDEVCIYNHASMHILKSSIPCMCMDV